MKILQVINVRWHNATAWFALRQARLLAESGHQVLVLTIPDSPLIQEAAQLGLATATLPLNTRNPVRLLLLPLAIRRLVKRFEPQVVNCHRGESFLFFGLLKRLGMGFALVRTRGDQRLPKANAVNKWLHTRAADLVVAANPALYRAFRLSLGVPRQRLRLIYGGVDTHAFAFDARGRERVRKEFGYGPEHKVVGLLGRFDRVKGHKELLEAVGLIRREQGREDLRVLLIGFPTAADDEDILTWAEAAGVADITRSTGRRADVTACISALDLAVIPSLWSEAVARSAMEIMACERPLISSDAGVLPVLLPCRAVFPAGDVAAMAAKMTQALDEPGFAASLVASQTRRLRLLRDEEFLKRSLEAMAAASTRNSNAS